MADRNSKPNDGAPASCCGKHGPAHQHGHAHPHGHTHAAHPATPAAIDPVCGMTVDPATAKHSHAHDGTTYYFCSARCREKFAADPAGYLAPTEAAPPSDPGAVYTCPMHPEIRQIGPGACPICGMALEPEVATAGDAPNPELADMTRRLWIALALTIPVFVLEMGSHLWGHHMLDRQTSNFVQLALATPVVLWAGWPFFERGWASLKTRNLNMFTLIAIGTGVAWIYSIVGTLAPSLFPAAMRDENGSVAVYFEPRPSSLRWSSSAKCWSYAPASAPAALSAHSSISPPKPRGASEPTAPTKTLHWPASRPATACACVRASTCPSTVKSWKAAAPSTNPS